MHPSKVAAQNIAHASHTTYSVLFWCVVGSSGPLAQSQHILSAARDLSRSRSVLTECIGDHGAAPAVPRRGQRGKPPGKHTFARDVHLSSTSAQRQLHELACINLVIIVV